MGNLIKIFLLKLLIILSPIADAYTKEGFCILKQPYQHFIGMLRFSSKEEVIKKCNGKMIFVFKENKCREFHSFGMKFPILIIDDYGSHFLDINQETTVCGKIIIEKPMP